MANNPSKYEARSTELIDQALQVLETRLQYRTEGEPFTCPADSRNYLRLKLAAYEHEVFAVMFLDNRHRLIAFEELFRGTINGCSVHPREVAKRALHHNAAALVVAHNHPSGDPEPSRTDEAITQKLKEGLALLDIRLLDHIIVGSRDTISLAERGYI